MVPTGRSYHKEYSCEISKLRSAFLTTIEIIISKGGVFNSGCDRCLFLIGYIGFYAVSTIVQPYYDDCSFLEMHCNAFLATIEM